MNEGAAMNKRRWIAPAPAAVKRLAPPGSVV